MASESSSSETKDLLDNGGVVGESINSPKTVSGTIRGDPPGSKAGTGLGVRLSPFDCFGSFEVLAETG